MAGRRVPCLAGEGVGDTDQGPPGGRRLPKRRSATELYELFCRWWKRFVGNFPPKQKKLGSYLRERFRFEKTGGLFRYYGIEINPAISWELNPDKEKDDGKRPWDH